MKCPSFPTVFCVISMMVLICPEGVGQHKSTLEFSSVILYNVNDN